MAEPTDEQLLKEAHALAEADARKRLPWWPFFYCVLPVLLALGLVVFVNRPNNNDGRENANNGPIPDLGSKGRPVPPRENAPELPPDSPADGDKPGDGAKDGDSTDKPPDNPPEEPRKLSDFEIDIHIRALARAVNANNGPAVETEQKWLRDTPPRDQIEAKIVVAMDSEQSARVRKALFECLGGEKALEVALAAYRSRNAKFMGTETTLTDGEAEELQAYAFSILDDTRREPPNATQLELARNYLRTELPEWVGRPVNRLCYFYRFDENGPTSLAALVDDAEGFLRRTKKRKYMEVACIMWAWASKFGSQGEFLTALTASDLAVHLPLALSATKQRVEEYVRGRDDSEDKNVKAQWFLRLSTTSPELVEVFRAVLQGGADKDLKQRMIEAMVEYDSGMNQLIRDGVKRSDANYGDYLEALGRISDSPADLDDLRRAADATDAQSARAAVVGLKHSTMSAAEERIKDVLVNGKNDGVKADALAVLIERYPRDKNKLVDEYIAADKPVGLRVVALAQVPISDLDRLKELAENDKELRVRQAALNRLGTVKDKRLILFFRGVARHDHERVLRQLAAKYADELEKLK